MGAVPFRDWLERAKPRSQIAYHIGLLCQEREHDAKLDRVAKEAWAAYEAGKVHLVQKRLSGEGALYIAVRR